MSFCAQAAERIECERCRATHAAYGTEPPCGPENKMDPARCDQMTVTLAPGNIEAWELYRRVVNQTLPDGFGTGPVNRLAVYATLDRMAVPPEQQLELADRVCRVAARVRKQLDKRTQP